MTAPKGSRGRRAVRAVVPLGLVWAAVGCSSSSSTGMATKAAAGGRAAEVDAIIAPLRADDPPKSDYDRQQQEQYARIVENDFRAVATDPLSTFSADVNTASYSNVRRFLNERKLPPKDAVFLAELVNYFPYSYPPPDGDDPVSVTLDLAACPWKPGHHLARIGLKAKQLDPAAAPPRNLVFLIDTSGSMEGPTRLPLVKKSLKLLVNTLSPRDTVSVVTYAGDADLKLGPTPGTRTATIRNVVEGLHAGGGTNGGGGIRMAYDQARRSFVEGGVNRVVLCTDGDFNVGVTSEGDLTRLIEEQRRTNVFLTVLGFGMGNLKNGVLEQLANRGNGHYAYIDSEGEAHKVFVEQGGALTTVAKDVKLQVEFNPARVAAYRLLGYENRLLRNEDFRNDGKDAGDMGSGHTVTALYEIVPAGADVDLPGVGKLKYQKGGGAPTAAAGSGEWLTVKMRYKHPEAETSRELARVLPGDAFGRPASADFRFAAAAAEFGLLLRDSPHKGAADYDRAIAAASAAVGADPGGHRAEFVGLARAARKLAGGGGEERARR